MKRWKFLPQGFISTKKIPRGNFGILRQWQGLDDKLPADTG